MLKNFSSRVYVPCFLALFVLAGISAGFLNLTARPVSGHDNESEILEIEGDFVRRISFSSNDIIFNPQDQMLYASRPSSAGSSGNSIARINPLTGELVSSVFVGSEPAKLALSDNGQALYVALDGANSVRRFDTVNQTAGIEIALGSDSDSPFTASDVAVVPGTSDTVAIARYRSNVSPPGGGVAIYNNGVRLPNVGPGHSAGANFLAFANSSVLYGGGVYEGLRTMNVDGNGVTAQPVNPGFTVGRIKYANGLVYSSAGQVIDPVSRLLVGSFANAASNAFVPDSGVGRVYFAIRDSGSNSVTIKAFDMNTYIFIGGLTIPNVPGEPTALVRYKSNGLALRTADNQLFLIQTGLIPTGEPLPTPSATPTVTPMPPTVYQSFTRELSLAGKDLIYHEDTQKIYVSVQSSDAARGNTITRLDPATGNLESSVYVGSEPGKLALSDDRQTLYVGIDGAGAIRKFDIASQTPGAQFSLGFDDDGPNRARDIDFLPGSTDTLAVSLIYYYGRAAIYDAGVKRPQNATANGPIEFGSAAELYVNGNPISKFAVGASGLSLAGSVLHSGDGDFKFEDGLIYSDNGKVIDPATRSVKGTFNGLGMTSILTVDVPNNRVFFLTRGNSTSSYVLRAYDLTTFLQVGSIPLNVSYFNDPPSSLIRWGANGLAFRTNDGRVYLIQSNLVSSTGTVPTPTPTVPTPTPTPAYIPTFVRQVNLPANDIVYGASTGALYATVPSVAGAGRGNTITKINPLTGALENSVFIGSEPSLMAISPDASTIYAKLNGAGNAVRRFDVATQTPNLQFTPDGDFQLIGDMEVLPGNNQALAIGAREDGVAIYDNGVRRSLTSDPGLSGVSSLEFADASTIYGYNAGSSSFQLARFTVAANGVTGVNLGGDLISGHYTFIKYADGLLYSNYGRIIDPATRTALGTVPGTGSAMAVDTSKRRMFLIDRNVLSAYDIDTFLKVGSVTLPSFGGTPTSLVRWGENGLAFRTTNTNSSVNDSAVYIVQTALVSANGTVPTGIQLSAANYDANEASPALTITVTRTGDLSTPSTVDYATVEGTASAGNDFTPVSGTFSFAAGEGSKIVTVPILNDDFYEGAETFSFTLSNPTGTNINLLQPATAVVRLLDNENPPSVLVDPVTVTEPVVGATSPATFTVTLTNAASVNVTYNYSTLGASAMSGIDFQPAAGTLVFAPFETTKTITVNIFGDNNNYEPDERFYLNIENNFYFRQIAATIVNYNPQTARRAPFDFDGDNRSDVSVFRPVDSVWHLNQSQAGYGAVRFGFATDRLVPADYDGDGKTDVAVFRDGVWHILKSAFGYASVQFGLAGDIPAPGDYDGDGFADLAVFRPSDRFWYIWNSSGGVSIFQFGLATDKLVPADYDGDGKTDVAVFRPSNGVWYVQGSLSGFMSGEFGVAADVPVPADYDSDRKADLAVYRDGVWYILQTTNNQARIVQFGLANDKPAPADYDGDAKADIAVFREGVWYINQSSGGIVITQFGLSGDLPVPNSYVP